MKKRVKIEKGSGNVFLDIGFPPGQAHNLLLRAEMMMRIEDFVRKSGLTQQAAARVLGMSTPRPVPVEPPRGADERTLYLSSKLSPTPPQYPRRAGIARKRRIRT